MSQDSVTSTPRRCHGTSPESSTSNNTYDLEERGIQAAATECNTLRQPRSAGTRFRSSQTTLGDFSGSSSDLGAENGGGDSTPIEGTSSIWLRLINFIQPPPTARLQHHPIDCPDAYKDGYKQFRNMSFEEYPDGWPRLAAFKESSNSFGIYRTFAMSHTRLLDIHMSSITEMETRLYNIDKQDELDGAAWRLRNRYHAEGLDEPKRVLQEKLEKEILAYDNLLLKFVALKSMSRTPARDQDSVFKWLWANKTLDEGEYDWIFHQDLVSIVSPRRNRFEKFISSYLDCWPNSVLKHFFRTGERKSSNDATVKFYCMTRIHMCARLLVVFFAVLVLLIPVILFFWTSMSKASMSVVVLTFVFMFSVLMSILTDAGEKEIFVGTATYCAVLVTFLGNLQKKDPD